MGGVTIVFGVKVFGVVDKVPGGFCVGTRFVHIWYLPLIPLGSYVVLDWTEDGFEGIRKPLDLKSIAFAWLRAALILGAIATFALSIFGPAGYTSGTWLAAGIGCIALFLFTHALAKATPARARELAEWISDRMELVETATRERKTRRRAPPPLAPERRVDPAAGPYRSPDPPRRTGWRPPPVPSTVSPP